MILLYKTNIRYGGDFMLRKYLIVIIGIFLISTAVAGNGIGVGITKTYNDSQNFYQGSLFSTFGIFGVNLRVIDFKGNSGEKYLFTPYLQLVLSSSKEFTTIYGGASPIISYDNGKIEFDNLYFANIGLKITLAIFAVYAEANFLAEIDFDNNVIQLSDSPMITIGGMLYVK
jgi:hypothetical protein